jgi:hypothetical protein
MKFTGHESFVCRYAWLPKAFRALAEDEATFLNEETAMVRLGVWCVSVLARIWFDLSASGSR